MDEKRFGECNKATAHRLSLTKPKCVKTFKKCCLMPDTYNGKE